MKSIICPTCKEKNNPTFSHCWKCKSQLNSDDAFDSEFATERNSEKRIGQVLETVLASFFGDMFSKSDYEYPMRSPLGATPEYTFLNLLDKWVLINRRQNFKYLQSVEDKYNFLVSIRQYSAEEKEKLHKRKVTDYRSAILAIIDFEYSEGNPNDPDGLQYEIIKEELKERFAQLETYYKALLGINAID